MKRDFFSIFALIFVLTATLFGCLTFYLLNLKSLGDHGMLVAGGLGFLCGAVFGVGIGYFVRTAAYSFDIDPCVDIDTRLQILLLDMGYRLENRFKKVMTFIPTFRAGIFADRIRAELMPGYVMLEGPYWHIEKIRRALGV